MALKNAALVIAALAAAFAAGTADAQQIKGKSAGSLMVRARALAVVPQEDGEVAAAGLGTIGEAEVDEDYIPELDFTYFVTDNIAAELILGTSRHNVNAGLNAGAAALLGTSTVDAGKVSLLPPTLTLQYHFNPKGQFSPYLGAGVNYTIFYNEDSGALSSTDYENSFGVALQAGLDVALGGPWYLNVDVKKLWLNTDLKASLGATAVTSDVDLNPWLIGVGVGYVF
ncbi:MAG TPA: OmpW family outer membrane protein [Azospirillaceae bacterium]|nr:OmpW family outer membrane protein [Azospirillaceae bacterium]